MSKLTHRDLLRQLRAYSRDVDSLTGLAEIEREVEALMHDTVARLRSTDGGAHSWAEIGAMLGTGRSAAQERFRKAGGVRTPGGQPSHLR